jgi:hypothetical protein
VSSRPLCAAQGDPVPTKHTHILTQAGYKRLTPVILATWEADIGRITVGGQPGKIVLETLISKITEQNELKV